MIILHEETRAVAPGLLRRLYARVATANDDRALAAPPSVDRRALLLVASGVRRRSRRAGAGVRKITPLPAAPGATHPRPVPMLAWDACVQG